MKNDRVALHTLKLSIVLMSLSVASFCEGATNLTAPSIRPFEQLSESSAPRVFAVRGDALRQASAQGGKVVMEGLSLESGLAVTLDMEPTRVVRPDTRIVIGRAGGVDEPFPYDVSQVQVFHGKVRGHRDSQAVLFSSPRGVRAHIDLSPHQRYLLSTIASDGQVAGAALAEITSVPSRTDRVPDVPLCGHDAVAPPHNATSDGHVAGCCFEPDPSVVYHKRLAVVEIALETDYELYANFNDLTATTDYIIELMARNNALFLRDVDTRFDVVFMRLFDNPADEPSFMNNPDPLNGYVNFWNNNMGAVARDTGAFLTGRRDLPYGGVAYIGAVCSNLAYCVCGYLNGFPDPNIPNSGDYDLGVVSHELGHNFNGCHTPDYCPQIDQCFPPPTTPQRGTMMSYCSQTVSGGNMVTELWYHTRLRRVMRDFVEFSAFCLSYDCNHNGVDDNEDLAAPGSDVNGNSILDVCEDCNGNGTLDPAEIAGNPSLDLNGNDIPDGCEPDCNGNGSPDDRDIRLGTSLDMWGNGVPDECDVDCDGNGVADYNQIQENLATDIDRNVVLDSCQDCDNDGTNDIVEVMGARNAWVASDVLSYIGEFHAVSGVRIKTSPSGQVTAAQDLIIAPGNRVLVTSATANKVVMFHAITGVPLGDFVPAGSGGLSNPTGLTMGPNGNLFVSNRNGNNVLQFDGSTGTFIGVFAAAGAGGLSAPFGLAFGPNGNLFVTSAGTHVLEFDGASGAFVRVFVSPGNNGGLAGARGILFLPDGHLLVASFNSDALLRYDGVTGAFLGKWNSGGTTSALYLDGPWGLRLGPNGNVFATRDLPSTFGGNGHGHGDHDHDHDHDHDADTADLIAPLHVTAARIMEFDIDNGQYLQSFVLGDDTGLRSPTGFDFMPATGDCNFNLIPDSCDLSACGGDPACSDCNANQLPDACDIASCAGSAACGDCNENSVPDSCDISGGGSVDVDPADGIPDECNVVITPPSLPLIDPGGLAKTRFITFTVPPTGANEETALRITLTSLHHVEPPYTGGPSAPFTSFEGQKRWVGPSIGFVESTMSQAPFKAAILQCTPHYEDWGAVGLVHVTGSAIVPSSMYHVENVGVSCVGNEAACTAVSAPLAIATTRWGDVQSPYSPPSPTVQPDTSDMSALIDKFRGAPGAPNKARALLAGESGNPFGEITPAVLQVDVDFSHISSCVDAFRGVPYPYTISSCP